FHVTVVQTCALPICPNLQIALSKKLRVRPGITLKSVAVLVLNSIETFFRLLLVRRPFDLHPVTGSNNIIHLALLLKKLLSLTLAANKNIVIRVISGVLGRVYALLTRKVVHSSHTPHLWLMSQDRAALLLPSQVSKAPHRRAAPSDRRDHLPGATCYGKWRRFYAGFQGCY